MKFAILVAFAVPLGAAELTVPSPDGRIQFQLSWQGKQRLEYAVTFGGKPAIDASPLGIVVDRVNLAEGVQAGQPERYQVDETYPWHGPHATAVNRGNGVNLPLHPKAAFAYTLEIRAYDDGVAFRHIVPGEGQPRAGRGDRASACPAGHYRLVPRH